jgi:hypothetical protein
MIMMKILKICLKLYYFITLFFTSKEITKCLNQSERKNVNLVSLLIPVQVKVKVNQSHYSP